MEWLLVVVALLVIVGLLALSHWYLWRRLVRDTSRSRTLRRVAAIVLVLLALSIPAALATAPRLPWISWIGYLWMAVLFYMLLVLAVLEIPRAIANRLVRRGPTTLVRAGEPADRRSVSAGSAPELEISVPEPGASVPEPEVSAPGPEASPIADPTPQADTDAEAGAVTGRVATRISDHDEGRRRLIARSAAIVAGLTVAGTVGYGVRSALGPIRLDRVGITLAKLPASMDGYRVALVSDIHLGPLSGRSRTERIVKMINDLDADFVAICGDLVDGSVAELGYAAEPLRDLRARRGSFFVTGNHEYYSGYQQWIDEVALLGVRPLRNERVALDGLDLAGVNDATGGGSGDPPDYAKALDGRDHGRPVILLAHQPVQAHEAAKHGVDLQLSGHTHGGQMVPFNLVVRAQQPVVSGYGVVDGTQVYVTNGAGFWGPPVRVGAPAEVTLVELRAR